MRYVAGINHEARVIYSGNVPNGRDITNLCRHEPVVMAKGAKIQVLSRFVTGQGWKLSRDDRVESRQP